jgi:ankyrin repeat protein
LKREADGNAQGGYFGNALQAAIKEGHVEIVRLLLEKGADVHARSTPTVTLSRPPRKEAVSRL